VLLSASTPVIDVRSPAEFLHAGFPGAHSIPLFDDEQRKVIGTLYKQQSREIAIKKGLEFFGPKMRGIVEQAEEINDAANKPRDEDSKKILIHCWRGGMRSGAIAWLLDLYGFEVYQLNGGYKAYRNWVLAQFAKQYNFR
jgi:tRNA 2-selenouridine synthase